MPRRTRTLALVVLAALVIGLLPSGNSDRPDPRLRPEVMHPMVTDEGAYLNNGYAQGAYVRTLPGNLVGFNEDGTIAATYSSGGQVKGYRLDTGELAWQADGKQTAALRCEALEKDPDYELWYGGNSEAYLWCWHEGGRAPIAALDLSTGRWIDLGFFNRYYDFEFRDYHDGFMQVTVRDSPTGEIRFVLLDLKGNETYSLNVFRAADGAKLQDPRTWCQMLVDRVYCWRGESEVWTFDSASRTLLRKFGAAGSVGITADGYRVSSSGHVAGNDYYNLKGELVGSTDDAAHGRCTLIPSWPVMYSNADRLSQVFDCRFKLIGPSGRVFAVDFDYYDSTIVLTQANVKIPRGYPGSLRGDISFDEKVIAIIPTSDDDLSPDGVRLFDPYTGRLIASFPLAWADTTMGIIYWTAKKHEPDNLAGTQVLVPGT